MFSCRKKAIGTFEQIIGQLQVEEKNWVRHSVKLDHTPEDKRSINKPSTTRPGIDIIPYNTRTNTIYLHEVKSCLDSPRVVYKHVAIEQDEQSGRSSCLEQRTQGKHQQNGYMKTGANLVISRKVQGFLSVL